MTLPPQIPAGLPLAQLVQRLVESNNALRAYCQALTPRVSPTVRPDMTAIGTTYQADAVKAVTTPATTAQTIRPLGMVFRGEYSTLLDYEPGDVVVVFGGISSGQFVCITLAPAGAPAPGVAANESWFRLSAGFTPFVWE